MDVYLRICGEKLKNNVIQSWWIYLKENRRKNVSVLMNLHQDFETMKQVFIKQQWMFW